MFLTESCPATIKLLSFIQAKDQGKPLEWSRKPKIRVHFVRFFSLGSSITFLSTPTVTEKKNGFFYIKGCIYTAKEDMTAHAYLLINGSYNMSLLGVSVNLNVTTPTPTNLTTESLSKSRRRRFLFKEKPKIPKIPKVPEIPKIPDITDKGKDIIDKAKELTQTYLYQLPDTKLSKSGKYQCGIFQNENMDNPVLSGKSEFIKLPGICYSYLQNSERCKNIVLLKKRE